MVIYLRISVSESDCELFLNKKIEKNNDKQKFINLYIKIIKINY